MNNQNFIPIVLCAGFGTRLRPITNTIPKVVCPIIDKPLAFFSIEKFFHAGFEKVYCNTHYKSEVVEKELKACAENFGYDPTRIIFVYEPHILGSGGGVLNILNKISEDEKQNKDIIVASGDVVADFPLAQMIEHWHQKDKDVLALMLSVELAENRDDVLCVSQDGNSVVGFGKEFLDNNLDISIQKRMFSNHQIVDKSVFQNQKVKFGSSVDLFYKPILNEMQKQILHLDYPKNAYWFNVGDIEEYNKCLHFFCNERSCGYPPELKMHALLADETTQFLKNFFTHHMKQ